MFIKHANVYMYLAPFEGRLFCSIFSESLKIVITFLKENSKGCARSSRSKYLRLHIDQYKDLKTHVCEPMYNAAVYSISV